MHNQGKLKNIDRYIELVYRQIEAEPGEQVKKYNQKIKSIK